jgi:hypothetical protein
VSDASVSTRRVRGPVEAPERILSWRRPILSWALGALAGVAVAVLGEPELSVLAGWIVASGVLLSWV